MTEQICRKTKLWSIPTNLQFINQSNHKPFTISPSPLEGEGAQRADEGSTFYTDSSLHSDLLQTSTPKNKLFSSSSFSLPNNVNSPSPLAGEELALSLSKGAQRADEGELLTTPIAPTLLKGLALGALIVGGIYYGPAILAGLTLKTAFLGGAALFAGATLAGCGPTCETGNDLPISEELLVGREYKIPFGGEAYYNSEQQGADRFTINIEEKPDWAEYDPNTGILTCKPTAKSSEPFLVIASIKSTESSCEANQVFKFSVVDRLSDSSSVLTDRDADGHLSEAAGGDDCDDRDPHKFPLLKNSEVNRFGPEIPPGTTLTTCPNKPGDCQNAAIEVIRANDVTIDLDGTYCEGDYLQKADGSPLELKAVINVEDSQGVSVKNWKVEQKEGAEVPFLSVRNTKDGQFELEGNQEGCGGAVVVENSQGIQLMIQYEGWDSPLTSDEQSTGIEVLESRLVRHLGESACMDKSPMIRVKGDQHTFKSNRLIHFGILIDENANDIEISGRNIIGSSLEGDIQPQGICIKGAKVLIQDNIVRNSDIAIDVGPQAREVIIAKNNLRDENNQCVIVDPAAEQVHVMSDNEGCE